MRNKDIIMIRRYGNFRVYSLKNSNLKVEIMLCMNPNVYVNTGYYFTHGQCLPEFLMTRAYSSGKCAALAGLKYLQNHKTSPMVKL